jgi:hypothetical protein
LNKVQSDIYLFLMFPISWRRSRKGLSFPFLEKRALARLDRGGLVLGDIWE